MADTTRNQQQLAEACMRHMYADDKASQAMGIAIESVAPGRATATMTIRDDMLNGHRVCHGGYIFALADSAFAFACNSQNHAAVAAGCSIDFVRPGNGGDKLTALAEVRQQGGRTGLYDITITNQHGEPVAYFRGRSYRLNRPVLPEDSKHE